jgi:hypothetical protein
MSPAFRRYLDHLDQLRRVREDPDEDTDDLLRLAEEPILDEMDAIWSELSTDERLHMDAYSWRAFPEDYAVATALPSDVSVWERPGAGPREVAGLT